MYKLFLFVAFLAFAAAAPGSLLSPALTYSAPIYNTGYAGAYAAPYAYTALSSPLAYSYSGLSPYAYKAPAYYY